MPDGGRNPTFDEKFHIPLIEGLRELNVVVWNSNTLTHDDFIGSGRFVLLSSISMVNSSYCLVSNHWLRLCFLVEYICTRCLQMDMMIPHGHFRHAT